MSNRFITAVDIGTSWISVLAAEETEKGPRVLDLCTMPSRGLRKGVVVNIEEAAHSIRSAVKEAEASTGRKISSVVISITGQHIIGFASTGLIGLQGRDITVADKTKAVESARTVYMPLDREVLHVIPTEFMLDGRRGITDPVGMSGARLESTVHTLTAYAPSVQNLAKACELAGLEVLDMVFGPVASAEAVLTRDEIEQGALLIDIGGGTTDIALFRHKAMAHASVLGIGGLHITNDLAVGLKVSVAEAERIKTTVGLASVRALAKEETIEISLHDGQLQKANRQLIASIIQPRCEELFEKVTEEVRKFSAGDALAYSVVLTGGTALLPGISGLAASTLGMPARVGLPKGVTGMKNILRTPSHAVVVGLVAYAAQREEQTAFLHDRTASVLAGVTKKIKNAFGYKDFLETAQKKKKGVSYV